VCQRMGWSWSELAETPHDVVVALVALLTEQSREASQAGAAQSVTRPRRRR
jgi:hypothetical protein